MQEKPSRVFEWAKRLENTKVTFWTVLAFIGVLGLVCLAAAFVGYLAHQLRR